MDETKVLELLERFVVAQEKMAMALANIDKHGISIGGVEQKAVKVELSGDLGLSNGSGSQLDIYLNNVDEENAIHVN